MTETDRDEIRREYESLRGWLRGILAALVVSALSALLSVGALYERVDQLERRDTERAVVIETIRVREATRDTATARLEERLLAMTEALRRIEAGLAKISGGPR